MGGPMQLLNSLVFRDLAMGYTRCQTYLQCQRVCAYRFVWLWMSSSLTVSIQTLSCCVSRHVRLHICTLAGASVCSTVTGFKYLKERQADALPQQDAKRNSLGFGVSCLKLGLFRVISQTRRCNVFILAAPMSILTLWWLFLRIVCWQ